MAHPLIRLEQVTTSVDAGGTVAETFDPSDTTAPFYGTEAGVLFDPGVHHA